MITLCIEDHITGKSYMNIMDFSSEKFPLPRIGEHISILIEESVEDEHNGKVKNVARLFIVNNVVHHYRSIFEMHRITILLEVTQIDKDYTNEIISKTI